MDRQGRSCRYATAERVWTAEPNRFLAAEVADRPAGNVLDLSAGEGRNAVRLARPRWRVTAVDFSDIGLHKASTVAAAAQVEIPTVRAADAVAEGGVLLEEAERERVRRTVEPPDGQREAIDALDRVRRVKGR